jgi:hypothetical protein
MKAILISAVALSVGLASTVQAGDLCLDAALGGPPNFEKPTITLRAFKYPKKNKCKSVSGVIAASSPAQPSAVTGADCTSFRGDTTSFTLVATYAASSARAQYSVGVSIEGDVSPGVMTAILPTGMNVTNQISAFECHDAFPDNL